MERQKKNGALPLLLIVAGCALYMVSGDIRSNFGIIVQALADRTGVSYADVSFAVAVGQLMYVVTQPIFGIVAMKKSNGFVLEVMGISCEPVRRDTFTGEKLTFFRDPDGLPIELHESLYDKSDGCRDFICQ